MKLSLYSGINFGYSDSYKRVQNNTSAYYDLPVNEKLDVLYDCMYYIRAKQNEYVEKVSENQSRLNYNLNTSFYRANIGVAPDKINDGLAEINRISPDRYIWG